LTAYEPIRLNGEISGILNVGVREKDLDLLQQAVEETHVGKHGFVYAADRDEVFALHPDRQGEAHESKDFILRAFF
jgi:methyl-accepting chemotaxis protein